MYRRPPLFIVAALLVVTAQIAMTTSFLDSSLQNATIRDETRVSSNTATRVGNALNAILEASALQMEEQSTDFTAQPGWIYSVETSGGPVTVTAPSPPDEDDMFAVVDPLGTWETNNCTVSFGAISLHSQPVPNNQYVGNAQYAYRLFRFDGTRWLIVR